MHELTDCQLIQWPDDQEAYTAAVNENPANAGITKSSTTGNRRKRSVFNYSKLWANGRTLKIAFMDELEADHKDKIIKAASQWLPYINLTFEFVDDLVGDIRIATTNNFNSSMLGTDALLIHPDDRTMDLGVKPDHPDFEVIVTHEFGHALGAMHEHQHPQARIPWNKEAAYEYLAKHHGWTREDVDSNVFDLEFPQAAIFGDYDKLSIMHYPTTNLIYGNDAVGLNLTLSDKDKAFARKIYPALNYGQLPA